MSEEFHSVALKKLVRETKSLINSESCIDAYNLIDIAIAHTELAASLYKSVGGAGLAARQFYMSADHYATEKSKESK